MFKEEQGFVPRLGNALQVLIINRISTKRQDPRSNDDQAAYCKNFLDGEYQGPSAIKLLQSQGSGEWLDRRELVEALELIESNKIDLVLCEDLGRIMRRTHAVIFCETCEDHDTRLIAINDHIDTLREDWRQNALFASLRHELANKDTSSRIKRTLSNRFLQFGGVLNLPSYGYIKPPGAKVDSEVTKDPVAEPIFDEWFKRLEDGASWAEVSDWLNSKNIDPGSKRKKRYWDANAVRSITRNPILKGERYRNRYKSKRINKTGRRKSVRASPEELKRRQCPHLCFIQPERFDRVNRLMVARNDFLVAGRKQAIASRNGLTRKPTIFPGQHIRCGVCGRVYYWGGNGRTDYMMCAGSRQYLCWNGFSLQGTA